MPLTQLSIEVPGLGDNSKNLEVEGAIAVGEKVAVSVTGLPSDVSTSEKELRLRVLGPMGEDVATHGGWNYDGTKKTYTTTLDLASVQAFRLFFPPPPPPVRPPVVPPVVPMRPPVPPQGYDPVAAAAAMQPPNAVNVRLVLELKDKDGSDSDADLLDASLLGTSSVRLNYWPTDWQTATLIDLANGRVYSKEEVDTILAEEARIRSEADTAETNARIAADADEATARANGDAAVSAHVDSEAARLGRSIGLVNALAMEAKARADAKYLKPSSGIPESDLSASVQASLGKADTALQEHQDISGKADLVGGKVPASQLPSYVDDVVEYASLSAFPATGEAGKIYVALDTNKTYRWSGSEYIQVGGGEMPAQVQADWDESDSDADSFIRHKPTIPDESDLLHKSGKETKAGQLTIYPESGKGRVVVGGSFSSSRGQLSVYGDGNVGTSSTPYTTIYPNKLSVHDGSVDAGSAARNFTYPATGGEFVVGSVVRSAQIGGTPGEPEDYEPVTVEPDANGKITISVPYISDNKFHPGVVCLEGVSVADVSAGHACTPAYAREEDKRRAWGSSLADGYSEVVPYAVGAYCTRSGVLYKCKTATSGTWDRTCWDAVSVADCKAEASHTHSSITSGDTTVAAVNGGTATITAPAQTLDDLKAYLGLSDTATFADVQTAMNLGDSATLEDALALVPAMVKRVATVDQIPAPTQQVQADWDESDSDDDAFIRNKPTIPEPVDISGKADSASIAPAFSTSSTYAVGDYVTHEGLLYKCTTAVSTAGAWNAANWTAVAVTDEMGADTPLPFDAEVEWVKVEPGAYVDPDFIVANSCFDAAMTVKIPSDVTPTEGSFRAGMWTGSASSSYQIYIGGSNAATKISAIKFANPVTLDNSAFVGQFATVKTVGSRFVAGENSTTFNGSVYSSPSGFRFLLCALDTGGTPTTCSHDVWIKSFVLYDNGQTIRNLIPVRVGTVGYLFDKISGRLFGSAVGSIPLVPGPDKATPTITKPDRLVEINERNNYLAYASTTTLAPETAVYRSALNNDGTFPTITDSGIPTAAAYYQFELELTVPSTVPSTITGPSGWVWLDGHGLPDPADLSGGETICISVRLDCTARTFLASVWRVA